MMDYKFIGWNKEDGSDKVWGAIYMEDRTIIRPKVLIFWGRRGKKLQTLSAPSVVFQPINL